MADSVNTSPDLPIAPSPDISRVYFLQPQIVHYRLPVWDGLVRRGAGLYELTVLGMLENGEAYGGGTRPYLREMAEVRLRVPGPTLLKWPAALDLIRRDKPDVVISAQNPRNVTCWKLPAACQQVGAAMVGHVKVHSVSHAPRFILTPMKRRFYAPLDFAICYGHAAQQELISLGFSRERSCVARNTIDTRRIFEQTQSITSRGMQLREQAGLRDKKILLCVGRMDTEKRHTDLLAAWPRLRDLSPSLVMVLVSGGPLLEDIRQRARRIDPDRILVTGRVPEGDDYAWIATADVTVYPGAVGLAINQSLALGRATIIADEYGADAEIVEHGVTGWRYPRGNVEALVRTVKQVTSDEPARHRVTQAARALMRDQVTIENMTDAFHTMIVRAIELSRTRKAAMGQNESR